jgi:hypothetical protein
MNAMSLRPGLRVRTATTLGDTTGMIIAPKILANRRPGASGTLRSYVPGHGGDVWFVEHAGGDIAAYAYDEFEADDSR